MPARIILMLFLVLAASAHATGRDPVTRTVSEIRIESVQPETDTGLDICLKDQTTGSRLRFDSSTGQYVVCGTDGTHEQGTGVVTQVGSVWTLSHSITFDAGPFETVHATVDMSSHQGHADVKSSDENRPFFTRFSISDPNFTANTDCSACPLLTAPNEGAINLSSGALHNLVGGNSSKSDFLLLQSYSLNSNFTGKLTRYSALIARNSSIVGDLTFQFTVFSDNHGAPGSQIYLGPAETLKNVSPLPSVFVHQGILDLAPGKLYWAGLRWNPSKSPLYIPLDESPSAPKTGIYACDSATSCDLLTSFPTYSQVRNVYISLDAKYPTVIGSAGMVRYGDGLSSNIISSKSRSCYTQIDLKPTGIYLLDARGGASSFPATDYSNAWARITPIASGTATGLDGFAETKYSMMKYSAFSYVTSSSLNICTRLEGVTDFKCRTVPDFQAGTCNYGRLVSLQGGFEQSCGNFQADLINRWQWSFGSSGWQSQALNPVTSTPAIVNPDFGGIWYGAGSWKLGTVYNFKKISGEIESQSFSGNQLLHKISLGTDLPPPGFLQSEASIMALDCSREGWCVDGHYSTVSGLNVADYIDFSQTTPEVKTFTLGPGLKGLDFGRAVSVNGRDRTALYGSYTTSPTANQYRLQLDYFKLDFSLRYTLSYDYGFGPAKYPLALSRADGDSGLGHSRGVSVFQDLQSGCDLSRIRMRSGGASSDSDSSSAAPSPCENLATIGHR